jgi:replication factor A1
MDDFETLVAELLGKRPELTREELARRIAEKKETVGAGYLTDQGALFLVAGELGVTLQHDVAVSEVPVKDLYIGANDVTTVARVLAVYPLSTYKRKDGGEGRYRRLVLFDGKNTVRLTAWDDKADEVEKLGIGIDVPVRVVSGYVKQGLDGKPNLNLGKRGGLEVVAEADVAKLPRLSAATERLTKVSQERAFVALECVVDSEPRYSEFVRSDGSPGSLFQFGVSAYDGKHEARVVIWGPTNRPELRPGQRVVITNVRSKRASSGEFEIHGDAGSNIVVGGGREPVMLRVVTASRSPAGTVFLAVDKDKRVRVVETGRDLADLAKGGVVRASPDEESGGRMVCRSEGAVEAAEGVDFPRLEELTTKLKDARDEASQIMVEVIALSHGTADDVHLKDGSVVKKGELVVGDDTAEMKVVGWRELSEKLPGIQPGERLRITGISPKVMRMGGWVLQLNVLTAVEKLRGKD